MMVALRPCMVQSCYRMFRDVEAHHCAVCLQARARNFCSRFDFALHTSTPAVPLLPSSGEARPVAKEVGAQVMGGTLNVGQGTLVVSGGERQSSSNYCVTCS